MCPIDVKLVPDKSDHSGNFFLYVSANGPTSTYFSTSNLRKNTNNSILIRSVFCFILKNIIMTSQVRGLGDAVYAVNCGGEAHTDLFGIKVLQTLLIQ